MEGWRLYIIIGILVLCALDLILTFYYVKVYKDWQPNKPYKLIELNPLLVFLWNNFGFYIGMFIGAVVLLAANYYVARHAHWLIVLVLLAALLFVLFNNHLKNIILLHKLIEAYPSGYLPESIFGIVVGNNNK